MQPMVERRLQRGRASLFYRLWPATTAGAPTLVLLHGFASNSTRWSNFAADTGLRPDWNILCPDLRGHGHSPWRGRLRGEHWLDDLAAMLDAEGIERADIGGHCLGANTALRFARRHPARTRRLVLIEPLDPTALGGRLARLRSLRGLLPWLAAPVRLANALGLYRRRLPVLDLAELDRETRARLNASGDTGVLTQRYGSVRHDLRYMAVAAYLQALAEVVRPLPALAQLPQPALVLLSSGGLFGDPAHTRATLAALPAATVELLDAEHWIPTEQPERMATLIDTWLST